MDTTSPVLSGLIRKRAEMAGEADALRARLAGIVANMSHLDAVIGLFDPSFVGTRDRGTAQERTRP